jgi:hypothetical protein
MHFDIADSVRINGTLTQYLAEDGTLCSDVWSSDRLGFGRMVRVCTQDDSKNGIVLSKRVVKTLDDQSGDAFSATVAVRCIVKGLAITGA